jgi:hypothetical protein
MIERSSDVALLMRIAELARRYGMRPSEADAYITFSQKGHDLGCYRLTFPNMAMPGIGPRYDKMLATLGVNSNGILEAEDFRVLEDAVERAMSLAPRMVSRSRS